MKNKRAALLSVLALLLSICYFTFRQFYSENLKNSAMELENNRTAYNFSLALDDENKRITAHETVKLKNTYKSGLKELVFHLYADSYNSAETKPSIGSIQKKLSEAEIGDIKINSVEIKHSKVNYTEDNQILKVYLSEELKPGDTTTVNIDFTLKIPKGRDRLGYYLDQYSITNWYPILSIYDEKNSVWDENPFYPVGESNYSDCSDYKLQITVPKGMVVASTGVKVSGIAEKSDEKISFDAENTRDFVLFMSKNYKVVSKVVDNVKVNSYYLINESTANRMLDLGSEALKFYDKTFGKYPYPEYDIVESYLQGGAMEYPTITQMGQYPRLAEEYKENNLTFFDEAVVHETGHQWWFSTVGNNEFKQPILDEAFTAYSTALFFENLYGEYGPLAVKSAFLKSPLKISSPIFRSTDKYTWQDFSLVVYKLGSVILEDLRQKVGKEKFLDIFRTYYERYKFKNASLDGFLEIVKEKSSSEISEYIRNSYTKDNYSMDKMVLSQDELKRVEKR